MKTSHVMNHSKTLTLLAALGAFTFQSLADERAEKGAQLILKSDELTATTTFEIRFDEPVATGAEVGREAKEPPLVFHPAAKGVFVWLSQRSGVFTPSEAMPLGMTYRITLRPGFADADGKPLKAELSRTVHTPPMRVNGFSPNNFTHRSNVPSKPEIQVLFNADVAPDQAAQFVFFQNAAGAKIAAEVRADPAKTYFPTYDTPDRSLLTWRQQFEEKQRIATLKNYRAATGSQPLEGAKNFLTVSPAQPLPVGNGWRLVVAQGLPSTDSEVSLMTRRELELGNITPFTVRGAVAENQINEKKHIALTFSKRLPEGVKPEDLSRWITISPVPENQRIVTTGMIEPAVIYLYGDFENGKPYRVTVASGFPAAEPFTIEKTWTESVTFQPIPSRLYFPEITTHQLSGGSRQLPLLAVNVPDVNLRAKLLDADTVVFALRDFRGYFREWRRGRNEDEPYQQLDYDKVAGRTIFAKQIAGSRESDEQQIVPVGWDEILHGRKTGVVFLAAEQGGAASDRKGAQTLVQITDLGLVWKCSSEEAVVHVFSHASGKPVAGAKVRLLDSKSATVAEAVADTQGVAWLPLAAEAASEDTRENGSWLIAQSGEDFHVVEFGENRDDVSLYRFKLHRHRGEVSADERQVMLFSDRGVYRPGETVQLKAIVRDRGDEGMEIPSGAKAVVRCFDPRGQKFFEKTLALTDTGSLAEAIKLPDGTLGRYTVRVIFTGEENAASQPDNDDAAHVLAFQVQEFQPNAFEVKIDTANAAASGDKLSLPVAAHYYMGKSLSKAKLHWSVKAHDAGFTPAGFGDYFFCLGSLTRDDSDEDESLDRGQTEIDLEGDGALGERGEFLVAAVVASNPKAPQPRSVNVLAEITDLDQQTVSESASFTRHSSEFYLGLKKFEAVLHEGDAVPVELVAVRADGQPWVPGVTATVKLTRLDWQTNRVEGAGRTGEFRSEAERAVVAKIETRSVPVRKDGTRFVAVSNTAPATMRVTEAGEYLVEASAKDSVGREVITSAVIHVSGKEELAWDYKNDFQVKLVPDRDEYLAGQTATLLVKTPISGQAWVTVEREKVLRSYLVRLEGNAPSIRVPIEKGDAPNVFVSVMLLRGTDESTRKVKAPDFRLGYCELKVTDPETKLSISVKPYRSEYEPGEEVSVTAEVKDATGAPAADAEITLYAVDEGVLSLTGYETPNPYAFFNLPRALGISTGLTLPKLLTEDPDAQTFSNKGYLIGDGGDEAGGQVRKNFLACAFWSANLRTDAEGRVTAKFNAPDSLTRYRVIAVAHTTRNRFGSGESAITVNKPLMIEPAMPRFGNVGDRINLRAVLHNTSNVTGDVEVSLKLDDTATVLPKNSNEFNASIHIDAHGSTALDIPVEFKEVGQAKWTWKAKLAGENGHEFKDAVESTLNVNYPAPLIQEIHSAHSEDAQVNLLAGVNPELLDGSGTIRVNVANSRMIAMVAPIQELLHYPYGCIEQTTSSTLPWLSLRDFQNALPGLKKTDAEIESAIERGVNRLFTMQTESGGLGYWPGATEPMLWGSAYGGLALALAQKQGHFVPKEKFERVCNYISRELRGTGADGFDQHYGHGGPSDRCLAVYTLALAGKPEPAYHELLFKKRSELSRENRALLALAILESNGSKEMVGELLKMSAPSEKPVDDYFHCDSREVAMQLLAWSQYRAADVNVDALVTELLDSRTRGHWFTTQGNAWSLLGLAGYVRNVERASQQASGGIAWGGEKQAFELAGRAAVHESGFRIDAKHAGRELTLSNPARTKLFTQVTVEARPRTIAQPRQDRGYSIQRTYAKIGDDGTVSELKEPRVGDRVLVTLRVGIRDRANYIAIDDPLPSIFEAINPEFKTQQTRAGEVVGDEWFSDFRELREDRALFFRDHVWPGTFTIRYLARVRAAGTATAPAAKIEEMYHPDRFGLTESVQLTSLPLN